MSRDEKALAQVLRGTSDANIGFDFLCRLLETLGFERRVRGDHHIFTKEGVAEILNLQPNRAKAKAYQVKQVRNMIVKYRLGSQEEDESDT